VRVSDIKDKHGLRVFENRMLRRIIGTIVALGETVFVWNWAANVPFAHSEVTQE
jgi:hypothetical protein